MSLALAANTQYNYNIRQSLLFRTLNSAYLTRTPTVNGSSTIWTLSVWVKRGSVSTDNTMIMSAGTSGGTGTAGQTGLYFMATNQLRFYDYQTGINNTDMRTTALFRDPSAWYHIVVVYASNNLLVPTDKFQLYVNGVRITNFDLATYPLDFQGTSFNTLTPQYIGRYSVSAALFNDGYMAEFNFIDGQALSPNYFGKTDPVTGSWVPIKYTGTYSGANSFYLPFNTSPESSYAGQFNGSSQYLNVANPTSALAFGTNNWTIEFWINYNSFANGPVIYDARPSGTNGLYPCIYLDQTTSAIKYYLNSADAITGTAIPTLNWNHIAVCRSSGLTRLFVNGVQVGSTYNDGGANLLNGAARPVIAANGNNVGASTLNGWVSNLRVVNGTALYTSNFTPPSGPLNAVPNTQLLTLQNSTVVDNSPNNYTLTNTGSVITIPVTPFSPIAVLGYDASGNGNNYTPVNMYIYPSPSGDSVTDTPTLTSGDRSNFCVFNQNWSGSGAVTTLGNTYYYYNTLNWATATGTIGVSSGKWYWEVRYNYGDYNMIGIMKANGISNVQNTNTYPGQYTDGWGYFSIGTLFNNSVGVAYGPSYTALDIIGVVLDMDAGTLSFYKNGVSLGVAVTGLTGTWVPAVGVYNGGAIINTGQQQFKYSIPAGCKKLSTYNLPNSTIPAGNKNMTVTTYAGNNISPTTISNGTTVYPDLIWLKSRTTSGYRNILQDSVRGLGKSLFSDGNNAESGNTNDLVSALSTGSFAVNLNYLGTTNNPSTNATGNNYVAWQWQAGAGTTSTNTAGSVTSTVSVNPTAGFSVVTYTNPGGANATVGHGLGVAPAMMIIKNRGTGDWGVWHKNLATPSTALLLLNSTGAQTNAATYWNSTLPGSSVFTLGTAWASGDLVAYCWAEVPGYSKFGSYVGNGSSDGTFVFTGFRPAFLMYKRYDAGTESWIMTDDKRNLYNVEDKYLAANLTIAEGTTPIADFCANGFKMRIAGADGNTSGGSYVYMAFAENPFKYANAR